jgi:hypothetical protein
MFQMDTSSITAPTKPSVCILRRDRKNGIVDCKNDFKFIAGCRVTFECWQAMTELSLDYRKCQLERVVVRGVWG